MRGLTLGLGLGLGGRGSGGAAPPAPDAVQTVMAAYPAASALYIKDFDPTRNRLFQDSAGTTPALIVSDPVGLVLDDGEDAMTINQPTAGQRGTIQQEASQWLWRGVAASNTGLATNWIPGVAATLILAAIPGSAADSDTLAGSQVDVTNAVRLTFTSGGTPRFILGSNGINSAQGDARTVPLVMAGRYDGTNFAVFDKRTSGAPAKFTGAQPAGSSGGLGVRIGGLNNNGVAAASYGGYVYSAFFINAAITDQEVADVATQFFQLLS